METAGTNDSYDLYWPLNENYGSITKMRAKVKNLGYIMDTKEVEKPHLIKLLHRDTRGLLCYDKCSNKELQTFATARNLTCYLGPNKSDQMTKLLRDLTIQTLLEEDDNLQFKKLLDLPAELRAYIYNYYCAGFADTLLLPTKPPLARICRQIRQEMLPVFYSTHDFVIELVRQRPNTPIFRANDQTHIWLSQLSSADAATINRLKVLVLDKVRRGTSQTSVEMVGTINIILNQKSKTGGVKVIRSTGNACLAPWTEAMRRSLQLILIQSLSESAVDKNGNLRFTLQSIYDIRKAVNKAYE